MVGVPCSCALLDRFSIGARVSLLWQQRRMPNVSECLYSLSAWFWRYCCCWPVDHSFSLFYVFIFYYLSGIREPMLKRKYSWSYRDSKSACLLLVIFAWLHPLRQWALAAWRTMERYDLVKKIMNIRILICSECHCHWTAIWLCDAIACNLLPKK